MNSKVVLSIATLLVIAVIGLFVSNYNQLVQNEESVSESFSDIESNLQRKIDLLPNLVKVVKAYAEHESKLLNSVTRLRASSVNKLNEIKSSHDASNKEQIKEMAALSKRLNSSTLQLFAVAENYPNLRSSEQFLRLQSQIEGSDNRINITRMQYNTSVKVFNARMRLFPANIVASLTGFELKEYFKAETPAHEKLVLDL